MADWDSADLLRRAKQLARVPATSAFDDASWYDLLTEANAEVVPRIVQLAPEAQYGAPTAMVTGDGGATFTLGNDADGDPKFPIGHCELYISKRHIPDQPMEPGVDFLIEGGTIRIPNDRTKTFPDGGPWARFVLMPAKINASGGNGPTLKPKPARMAIVYGAIELYAMRPGSGISPEKWAKKKDEAILNAVRTLRTQYNMQAETGDSSSYANSIALLGGN